jgi:hypothetical protein
MVLRHDVSASWHINKGYSYICWLVRVLHLIASDILMALRAEDHKTTMETCDSLQENKKIERLSALARLRILFLFAL